MKEKKELIQSILDKKFSNTDKIIAGKGGCTPFCKDVKCGPGSCDGPCPKECYEYCAENPSCQNNPGPYVP